MSMESENVNNSLISAQRAAHEQLRAMILTGTLQSGQKLRQEEIAKRLGLSRLPVREALNRLEIEGLVEQKPRRGFYVTSLDVDEIEDIFEMRAMLEAHAGALATQRRTPKDADDVDLALQALDRVVKSGFAKKFDYAAFAAVNAQFHNRIYVTSGRKYLLRQIVMLRNSVGPLIQIIAADKDEMSFAQDEHRLLARFYRQGNAAGVAEICREHCARTGRALVQRIAAHRQRT
jgi:DNA-binding GntR family transcriptional regulator